MWQTGTEVAGPFRLFRFTSRRTAGIQLSTVSIEQAYIVATTITELDEYAAGVHDCAPQANCINTNRSFACACSGGYEGNGTFCTDENECLNSTLNDCDVNATCMNNVGSFSCTCNAGRTGNGTVGGCADVDECISNTDNCHMNAMCGNNIGSFECSCNEGFSGDGLSCGDLDECLLVTSDCHSLASCLNMAGSFQCNCRAG
uniref:EGF-like domain-containing protein n=1 Tax=Chromera velia CCMP2878 TaxID=1169474 RepID=A0A0G4HT80_9ALVE|eukprot:Cvel_8409.t1-p1 / transcript=Cvel_8409.t1 / gene=Cvel_8409 / organism=Chromera_velia_CCMP2878 / gene_product=Fibrillin-2, putative / transcript_product=Fibrillin-2, putative / location=Cvel_scaffold464:50059-51855(-) / protein_length=201 / sequence_SO=supercontig / SO=protein_coding / is_pseudo=false